MGKKKTKIQKGMKLRGMKFEIIPGEFIWVASEMARVVWENEPHRLRRATRAGEIVRTVSEDESLAAASILIEVHHYPECFCLNDITIDFDRMVSSTCTRMRDLVMYASGDTPDTKWNVNIRGKNSKPVVFQKQATDSEIATVRLASLLAAHEVGEVVNWKAELPTLKAGHPKLLEAAAKLSEEEL